MSHYPQSASGWNAITYPVGPAAESITVTAHATPHTKGSYVELVASSPFACNRVIVAVTRGQTDTGLLYLLDLATGAAAAETVLVPNMTTENASSSSSHHAAGVFDFPLAIPSGTRIALRCQASIGSAILFVAVTLIAAADTPGVVSMTNYGANTGDSGATSVDPGGSLNTKGAYSELTASTAAIAQWLMVMVTLGGNTAPVGGSWAIDVATGGAGSETVLIPDLRIGTAATSVARVTVRSYACLVYIPAGTRIAVRASCNISDATDRLIDVAILTATAPAESAGGTHAYGYLG